MLTYNAYHPNGTGWVVPRPTQVLRLLNGQFLLQNTDFCPYYFQDYICLIQRLCIKLSIVRHRILYPGCFHSLRGLGILMAFC